MGNLSSHEIAQLDKTAINHECTRFRDEHDETCPRVDDDAGFCTEFSDWFTPRYEAVVAHWMRIGQPAKEALWKEFRWLISENPAAKEIVHQPYMHPRQLRYIEALYFGSKSTVGALVESYIEHDRSESTRQWIGNVGDFAEEHWAEWGSTPKERYGYIKDMEQILKRFKDGGRLASLPPSFPSSRSS
ncbi:hypothetical protein JCM10207_003756 [Rhodosporidiobolus poonsookiae]